MVTYSVHTHTEYRECLPKCFHAKRPEADHHTLASTMRGDETRLFLWCHRSQRRTREDESDSDQAKAKLHVCQQIWQCPTMGGRDAVGRIKSGPFGSGEHTAVCASQDTTMLVGGKYSVPQ